MCCIVLYCKVSESKTMTEKKIVIKYCFKAMITSILFVLFILVYFQDQITAFLKNRSTISSRYEKSEYQEFPTLTICFDSARKLSVSQKYGFEKVGDLFYKQVDNQTLLQVFDETSFVLGRDFQVSYLNGESMKMGKFNVQEYAGDQDFTFESEPIRTYYYGTCTKIEPKFEVKKAPLRFEMTISLNSKLLIEDVPKRLTLYFTSNKTWIGITDSIWPQFKPLTVNIDFQREHTFIYVKKVDKYFQFGQTDNSKCFEDLFSTYPCPVKCTLLDYCKGIYPLCQTVDELQCMWNHSFANISKHTDCFKTKLASTYDLVERIESPLHKQINKTSTTVYVGLWTMDKEVQEEVKLLTPEDFIGSVGGSLGMFFGFSIYASLLYCIEKALNRFFHK